MRLTKFVPSALINVNQYNAAIIIRLFLKNGRSRKIHESKKDQTVISYLIILFEITIWINAESLFLMYYIPNETNRINLHWFRLFLHRFGHKRFQCSPKTGLARGRLYFDWLLFLAIIVYIVIHRFNPADKEGNEWNEEIIQKGCLLQYCPCFCF